MSSDAFPFLLALLATWRVTHFLVLEDGPWDLVVRLRYRLGNSVAGRAMDCFYCLSMWVAAPLAFRVAPSPLGMVITWLALSGGASLLHAWTPSRESPSTPHRQE